MEEFITIALSEYAQKIRRLHGIKHVGIFHVEKESEKNKSFGAYTTYKVAVLFEDYETQEITILCKASQSTNKQLEQDKVHVNGLLKYEIYDSIITLMHKEPKVFEDIILGKPDRNRFICYHKSKNF